jgi:frataxin-like iron-binding protein CyaY
MTPKIRSKSGRQILLTSLRPGDWLDKPIQYHYHDAYVVRNSEPKQTVWLSWPRLGTPSPYTYKELVEGRWTYMGRGKKRKWWKKLPKWLRDNTAPYSKP